MRRNLLMFVIVMSGLLFCAGCAPQQGENMSDWIPDGITPGVSGGITGEGSIQDSSSNGKEQDETPSITPDGIKESEEEQRVISPVQKVLVVGNSITLGFGTHGMASSAVNTDYYYRVNQYLLEKNRSLEMKRIPGYAWEGGVSTEGRNRFLEETLKPELEEGCDLFIIQLGDNVNTPEKQETFANDAKELLRIVRETVPEIRILWVFGRYNLTNAEAIKSACAEYDAEYVDISIVSSDKKYQAELNSKYEKEDGTIGVIQDYGVASHPNDYGMQVISELIIDQLGYDEEG